jgi:hypothetical protein
MILGSTIPLATNEEVIAWNGERCSSWAAETALQGRSGILLARHIWKDNGPAAARAIGAKRKTRIADSLCGGRGDWEMLVGGGSGVRTPSQGSCFISKIRPIREPFMVCVRAEPSTSGLRQVVVISHPCPHLRATSCTTSNNS